MHRSVRAGRTVLGRLPLPERTFVADALRTETVGGVVLLAAAAVALIWANSPWRNAYESLRDFHFGIGVAMGLLLRVAKDGESGRRPAEQIAHVVRPASAGVAVPLFALFAAGVGVTGDALGAVAGDPEPLGVALGLVAGKVLGVFGGSYLAVRYTRARLGRDLAWADVLAVAMLAGVGFTVSLLMSDLAYHSAADRGDIKVAVLLGSLASALLAGLLLKLRNAKYRRLSEEDDPGENAGPVAGGSQQTDSPGGTSALRTPRAGRFGHSGSLPDSPHLDR
ncbi:Na+/H+ antiporter NhaA [Streptomyces caeni]|uniref:Na+/H+ antiporter NhaA n=1 Tax=Streptomyces caeni TaxID=2307231 RepID=A0ABW4IY28_9ACTN